MADRLLFCKVARRRKYILVTFALPRAYNDPYGLESLEQAKHRKEERIMRQHDFAARHGDPHQDIDDLIFTDQMDWCVSER